MSADERTLGGGTSRMDVPRGIELLVKKASVDPDFRKLLIEQSSAAAAEIELALDPTEHAMLETIPRAQLETIIDHTHVPDEQRRIFLGKVAAAILTAVGVGTLGCSPPTKGIRPDHPASRGIRPDSPKKNKPVKAEPAAPQKTETPPPDEGSTKTE